MAGAVGVVNLWALGPRLAPALALAFERYFGRSLELVRQLRKPERLEAVLAEIIRMGEVEP